MSVVGIDFGDESLTIAVARRQGIDVLQNDVGKRKTRSAISFTDTQRLVGDEAISYLQSNAMNSITCVKRILGKMYEDPDIVLERDMNTTSIVADENGRAAIQLTAFGEKDTVVTPEQCVASLLGKLKNVYDLNNDSAGAKMRDCVIAIPGWFTDSQRRAVLDGANMAGLNVMSLINEYLAVAIQYGISRPIPDGELRKVLFYDMGYSGTTVALVNFTKNGCKVESVAFDRNMGGRNLDEFLARHLAEKIKKQYGLDVYSNTRALLKLRKECDRVKQTLSANTLVPYMIEYLMDGQDVKGSVTREEFEDMVLNVNNYQERILAPIHRVLARSQAQGNLTSLSDIHSLEILGGSTRVPLIQNVLKQFLGRELSKTCDGDESVCRGATFYCAMRSPSMKVKDYDFKDISPYSYRLEWSSSNLSEPNRALAQGTQSRTNQNNASQTVSHNFKLTDFDPSDQVVFVKPLAPLPAVKSITIKEASLPLMLGIRYHDMQDNLATGYFQEFNGGSYVASLDQEADKIPVIGSNEPLPTRYNTVALGLLTIPSTQSTQGGVKLSEGETYRVRVKVRVDSDRCTIVSACALVEETITEVVPTPVNAKPQEGEKNAEGENAAAGAEGGEGNANKDQDGANQNNDMSDGQKKEGGDAQTPTTTTTTRKVLVERPLDWIMSYPFNLTEQERVAAHEGDAKHTHADRLVRDLAEMRNTLESYIFSMRSSATNSNELAPYFAPGEASKFVTQLNRAELWLEDLDDNSEEYYAEGNFADLPPRDQIIAKNSKLKQVLEAKLSELKQVGDGPERLLWESNNRVEAMDEYTKLIQRWYKFVSDIDPSNKSANAEDTSAMIQRYNHITLDERKEALSKLNQANAWLTDLQEGHASKRTELYQEPLVLVKDIRQHAYNLDQALVKIFNKPKPAAPKDTKQKDAKANKDAAPKDEAAGQQSPSASDANENATAGSEGENTPSTPGAGEEQPQKDSMDEQ